MAKINVIYHEIANVDMTGVHIEIIDDADVQQATYTNFSEYDDTEYEIWTNQTETLVIPNEALALVKTIIEANPTYKKK